MYTLKRMGPEKQIEGSINTEAHFQDAYKIASESVVLLKNQNDLLPLKTDGIKTIAVIGANALKTNALGGFGAGVKTKREVTPLQGLQNRLPSSIKVNYTPGYQERYAPKKESKFGDVTQERTPTIDDLDPQMVADAVEAARNSDAAIIFAGSNRDYETEASDRKDLQLPFGQVELIEKVLEANPNTIVVMIAGAPFDVQSISEKSKALVWSWFNGSEGGNALADVLLGNVNPSGKLPWTMPKKLEDSPAHATNSFPGDKTVSYEEGILVGYRWFDTKNIAPLYPFGYGLSYSQFKFADASAQNSTFTTNDIVEISVDVENLSSTAGKEVVQVYVSKSDSKIQRAAKELKAFKKVEIGAGASRKVTLHIPVKELAYYNVAAKEWMVEKGKYVLHIGNSSRNLPEEVTITIK